MNPKTPCPSRRRSGSVLVVAALTLGFITSPLVADKVWLDNGNYLEGDARELPNGEVEVASLAGSFRFPASRVVRIERTLTPEARITDWLESNPDADAEDIFLLAGEAREEGAATLARLLLERVVELDPDHTRARRSLGYQLFEDRWVTKDELHALRGEVFFRGEWIPRDMRARILAIEAAERARENDRADRLALAEIEREAAREERAEPQGNGIPVSYIWTPSFYPPPYYNGQPPRRHQPRPRPRDEAPKADPAPPERPRSTGPTPQHTGGRRVPAPKATPSSPPG